MRNEMTVEENLPKGGQRVLLRRIPTYLNATRWTKHGDLPNVKKMPRKQGHCSYCNQPISEHGLLSIRPHEDFLVCPGDFLSQTITGEYLIIKGKEIFDQYEILDVEDHELMMTEHSA